LAVALHAEPDFITLDGRAGGTAASPKYIKDSVGIPTVFTIYRARKYLDEHNGSDISLICTGGLRVSSDFAKAMALGADAVAIATSAMMAIGCKQYRICNTGKCPMGIATQNPDLRAEFNPDQASLQLHNFLKVCTLELQAFARLTGNNNIHNLTVNDLRTTNLEIANFTDVKHV
jgi:methylamine---glutamate N-methyltransferase subunit C